MAAEKEHFVVRGTVKDAAGTPVSNVKVFAVDSDQGFFEDHNDDLLGGEWVKPDGSFEISFSSEQFGEAVVEGNVDLYFVVRNSRGEIIARTEPVKGVRSGGKSDGHFDIVLDALEKKPGPEQDPYLRNMDRTLAAFAGLGDVAAVSNNDFARVFSLLTSSINAWVVYTRDNSWREIGYDGPQVPLRPRDLDHKHHLAWEAQK
ncbi:MAG TPA: hypothetical protein VJP79_09295 [Nitrososphaera sp.]|nr:hypothetical protein [Nitrososphaera sp.]